MYELFIIHENEYRQNIWQLFIEFKKAYQQYISGSLYKTMYEVEISNLIQLTNICMEISQ